MNRDEVRERQRLSTRGSFVPCAKCMALCIFYKREYYDYEVFSWRLCSISVQLIALKCQMRWWIKEIHLQCINQRWDQVTHFRIYPHHSLESPLSHPHKHVRGILVCLPILLTTMEHSNSSLHLSFLPSFPFLSLVVAGLMCLKSQSVTLSRSVLVHVAYKK